MTDEQTSRVDLTGQPEASPPAGSPQPDETHPAATSSQAGAPTATGTTPPTGTTLSPAATGSNRTRWVIALAVAGGAIAVAIAAFLLLRAPQAPEALRYIPSEAAVVLEVRPELPGDQMQKLGNLLAHFPGFQDQSNLTDKLDEAISRLVGTATEGEVDFRQDLKPWLNGPLFVGATTSTTGETVDGSILVSATTNGAVGCDPVMTGLTVETEVYRGLQVQKGTGPDSPVPVDQPACVVDGRQVLIGDLASVRAGLDAKADSTGIDRSETYRAARASLGGDRLITVFVDGETVRDALPIPSLGTDLPIPGLDALGGLGQVPDWLISGIRAEDDALVVDTVTAPLPTPTDGPSLLPLPATHPSVVAAMAPADTVLLIEDQGTGVSIQNLFTRLRSIPELSQPLAMLDGMGGADDLVGWITDLGVIVTGGEAPAGGVLLFAEDEAAAHDRYQTLAGFAGLMGLGGSGVEVRQTTISGVDVTTLVITDLGSVVPPGSIPGEVPIPAVGPVEVSFAAHGRALVVGSGEAFMTALLGVQPGSSLADQDGYARAVARGLGSSRSTVFVGVPAAIELVEGFLPAEALAEWTADVKPYVDPFDAVIITTTVDPTAGRSRVVVTVRQ